MHGFKRDRVGSSIYPKCFGIGLIFTWCAQQRPLWEDAIVPSSPWIYKILIKTSILWLKITLRIFEKWQLLPFNAKSIWESYSKDWFQWCCDQCEQESGVFLTGRPVHVSGGDLRKQWDSHRSASALRSILVTSKQPVSVSIVERVDLTHCNWVLANAIRNAQINLVGERVVLSVAHVVWPLSLTYHIS